MSRQFGVTQKNGTSTVKMQSPTSDEYAMVVMARSLPLIMRVMISVQAQPKAETIRKQRRGMECAAAGTHDHHDPDTASTMVASQRRKPTFIAEKSSIESAVTKIGATKARSPTRLGDGPGSAAR